MRAPASAGALTSSASRPDVSGLLDRLATEAAHEAEGCGDIVIPAIDVRPELNPAAINKSGVIEQSDGDLRLQFHPFFLAADHCFLELVEQAVLRREQCCELECVLHPDAAVASMSLGQTEESFGGR